MEKSDLAHDLSSLLFSWSSEFASSADRVRQLIGSKHWPSDGKHKEALLQNFLKKHLSSKYIIETGFICPSVKERVVSGEVDILICDPCKHPPWFNESGLVLTEPTSVLAHLHVKSAYTKQKLDEVIDSSYKAYISMNSTLDAKLPVWSGGFFFDTTNKDLDLKKVVNHVIGAINSKSRSHWVKNEFLKFPKTIAILDGIIVITELMCDQRIVVKGFKFEGLSVGIFFLNLWESLCVHENTTSDFIGALEQLDSDQFESVNKYIELRELKDEG